MDDQILSAREERFSIIKKLAKKHKILISLKANTPGVDKNRYSSFFLINQLNHILINNFEIAEKYMYNGPDGPYYIYTVKRDSINDLKRELIFIEEHHDLGRLVDLDLYYEGIMTSRDDIQVKQRKCMICEKPAFECIRSQKHSTLEVLRFIDLTIQQYLVKHLTEMIDKAILSELNMENKFGLVTPTSNGSHTDMDYHLMVRSKDIIMPYLIDIFILGFTHQHDDQLYHMARAEGLKAELEMLNKTNQINTYKGLIYLLGFVLLSISYVIKNNKSFENIFSHIKYLAKEVMLDFDQDVQTAGIKSYLDYHITGIRGEVFNGLPTVQKAQRYFSTISTSKNNNLHHLLLFFIQHSEDTVLLKRAGSLKNYHHYKQMASQVNPYIDKDLKAFTDYCINHHISFGGSADLLVLYQFLDYFKAFYH